MQKENLKDSAAQRGTKGAERQAAQDRTDVWARAAEDLREACTAVKSKKEDLLEKFQDLNQKRSEFGHISMDIPMEENPFDAGKINEVQRETGTPVEERKWAAMCKALNASIFRDNDFAGALVGILDTVRHDAISEDWKLQAQVNAAKEAREDAIRAADSAVAKAESALAQHRQRFADDFVKPVLEADNYGSDGIPSVFQTPRGLRNIGLRFGAAEPVEVQINTLWSVFLAATQSKPKGDPFYHLLHHAGGPIPGQSKGVAWTYEQLTATRKTPVAGKNGYVRTGGPTTKEAPRPKKGAWE